MDKANDRQIAGDHYSVNGRKIQHWDVARMFNFDPMQYQITKHVFRWKDKFETFEKRLQDLEKSGHYLQKYLEDAKEWDDKHVRLPPAHVMVMPRDQAAIDEEWDRQMAASHMFHQDGFTMGGDRYQCIFCKQLVEARSPLGALQTHPNCAAGARYHPPSTTPPVAV